MCAKIHSKWCWLIILAVLANASGMVSPILNSNDAYFYAVISKNMLQSNDWVNLMYGGKDWLDKPHFPFWITVLSYKIFGVNSFAYVFPGFIFHCLGAYFTYRLAKDLYSRETGLVAVLIYVTSLHLMLSALDIRAEAFLLGEIMPAIYFWWKYNRNAKFNYLLLGGLFTGMALMTKGLFVVVTIWGGFLILWWQQKQLWEFLRPKWLLAYLISGIFIIPELVCLYLQFDAHPEKIVFGGNHVSGLKWYFWGSQFGRFFNNGPITNNHGSPFFFIHTFLWAFLPWSLVFILATYSQLKTFLSLSTEERGKMVFLLASFWLSFIMFSATSFQLDHYTNIIMPFAAILCAHYILTAHSILERRLALIQRTLSYTLLFLLIVIIFLILKIQPLTLIVLLPLIFFLSFFFYPRKSQLQQILLMPALSIMAVIIVLEDINMEVYATYDNGYSIAQTLKNAPHYPIYSLNVPALINSLEFHSATKVENTSVAPSNYPYYLVVTHENLINFSGYTYQIINSYSGLPMEKFIPSLLSSKAMNNNLIDVDLLLITGKNSSRRPIFNN